MNDTRAISLLAPFDIDTFDTASNLDTLSATQIAFLASDGVTVMSATGGDVSLTATQASALAASGISVTQSLPVASSTC